MGPGPWIRARDTRKERKERGSFANEWEIGGSIGGTAVDTNRRTLCEESHKSLTFSSQLSLLLLLLSVILDQPLLFSVFPLLRYFFYHYYSLINCYSPTLRSVRGPVSLYTAHFARARGAASIQSSAADHARCHPPGLHISLISGRGF